MSPRASPRKPLFQRLRTESNREVTEMPNHKLMTQGVVCLLVFLWITPSHVMGTGRTIMDKAAANLASLDLRAVVRIETVKQGTQTKQRVFWLIIHPDQNKQTVFLEFIEPKESAGLRFLFQKDQQGELRGYMYVPEEGVVVALKGQDRSVDIGGTGLSVGDLLFVNRGGKQEERLVKEEKVEGTDCYVIEVEDAEGGKRIYWVSKDDSLIVRSRQQDARGKTQREFQVVKFFRSDDGKKFAREIQVTIPDKRLKTMAILEHAVFGISVPEELLDPKNFGTVKWRD